MSGVAASEDVFRAVADPTRRAMLDLLAEEERSVSELAEPFEMSQPAISQHLRVLREAGLVKRHRAGRKQIYRLDPRPLSDLYDWASSYEHLIEDPAGHVWGLRSRKKKDRSETGRARGRGGSDDKEQEGEEEQEEEG